MNLKEQQKKKNSSNKKKKKKSQIHQPTFMTFKRRFTYLKNDRILIIGIAPSFRERSRYKFNQLLTAKLINMGLNDKINSRVST